MTLMTAEELGKRWQVPTSHVYRLAREGQIPVVRLGRYVRFNPDVISKFERGELTASDIGCPDYPPDS